MSQKLVKHANGREAVEKTRILVIHNLSVTKAPTQLYPYIFPIEFEGKESKSNGYIDVGSRAYWRRTGGYRQRRARD